MIRWDDERQVLVVGDRTWIAQRGLWTDYDMPHDGEWGIIHERQVHVTFESGWSVSVIWGDLTYSSNHDARYGHDWAGHEVPPFTETPELVEVGLLRRGQGLVGDPFSYLDAPVLNRLLDRVQTLPTDATEQQVECLVLVGQGSDQRPEVLTELMHNEKGTPT